MKDAAHLARVRKVGCVICHRAAEAHHPIGYRWRAGYRKASDYDAIALCFDHHSAQTPLPFGYAVHKGTKSFEARFGSQEQLLEKTRRALVVQFPQFNPYNGERIAA